MTQEKLITCLKDILSVFRQKTSPFCCRPCPVEQKGDILVLSSGVSETLPKSPHLLLFFLFSFLRNLLPIRIIYAFTYFFPRLQH